MRPVSHFGSFVAALAFILVLAAAGAAADLARAATIPALDVARAGAQAHVTAELVRSRNAHLPPAARAVNTGHPDQVIGRGTPRSCTSAAVVRAVARGGVITFNCLSPAGQPER